MMTTTDKTLGTTDAADLLGVTRQRVHQMVQEGKLPGRMVYGKIRIPRDAVIRIRQEREPATRKE